MIKLVTRSKQEEKILIDIMIHNGYILSQATNAKAPGELLMVFKDDLNLASQSVVSTVMPVNKNTEHSVEVLYR